jgi:hypothetical protein
MTFAQIPAGIHTALARFAGMPAHDKSSLLAADAAARAFIMEHGATG